MREYLNQNIVNTIINFVIIVLIGLISFGWRENNSKLERKADKAVVEEQIKQVEKNSKILEKKIEEKYVDDAIKAHEKVDEAMYKGISDMFEVIMQGQKETREDIKEIIKNKS